MSLRMIDLKEMMGLLDKILRVHLKPLKATLLNCALLRRASRTPTLYTQKSGCQ